MVMGLEGWLDGLRAAGVPLRGKERCFAVRWATSGEPGPLGGSPNVLSFWNTFSEALLFELNNFLLSSCFFANEKVAECTHVLEKHCHAALIARKNPFGSCCF